MTMMISECHWLVNFCFLFPPPNKLQSLVIFYFQQFSLIFFWVWIKKMANYYLARQGLSTNLLTSSFRRFVKRAIKGCVLNVKLSKLSLFSILTLAEVRYKRKFRSRTFLPTTKICHEYMKPRRVFQINIIRMREKNRFECDAKNTKWYLTFRTRRNRKVLRVVSRRW